MTSNNSSNDSTTSPVLSSSPLGTLDDVQASMSSAQRNDSYENHDLEPSANGESGSVMESGNHEEDPLLAYRRESAKFGRPAVNREPPIHIPTSS